MIAIVDYGMGNLRSVQKAIEKVGFQADVTRSPQHIADADAVILPGVGAFKDCMDNLDNLGLITPVLKAISSGKPFLGICLGLQLLFSESLEFGRHPGLDVIKGVVKPFSPTMTDPDDPQELLKIPHMGWNSVQRQKPVPVLDGINDGDYFYFVHSYYVEPEDEKVVATRTDYGGEFVSAVAFDNVIATQFHPEKSQNQGLAILRDFATTTKKG
ncbi:MAG: imidazole glycerol phosphate synthase subunit HisH [Deltaproteobacteria bacterium]|nr:MAG: imidazole glycerol phosphate synthase subunit HisH [Deltaproteobacteria bacterium]